MMTDSLENRPQDDGIPTDTLREVIIIPDSLLPVDRVIRESLGQEQVIKVPKVSDVLDRLSPGLSDKIMHPFAIKERKRERRMQRHLKVMEEYSRVKTFDELLRDAYEQQILEDSLQRLRAK
ncbi:MAG: hypothetical protein E7105_00490 [Prevotella sp.]|nr:hypothetical protein [Prevotella sp.]